MKKFIISLFIIIIILFSAGHFVQAESFTVNRPIGYGRTSSCTCESEKNDLICVCNCQGTNDVDDCYVGFLIGDPICACCGDCTLNSLLSIGVNWAGGISSVLGVIALLFFVIGGIIWITSGGSAERVKKGKDMIKGAIVGLIIVFAAFTIVRVVTEALVGPDEAKEYLPNREKCTIDNKKDDGVCMDVGIIIYNQYIKDGTGLEDYKCIIGQCKGETTICCKKTTE